jgi:hypothetical protein
MTLYGYLLTSKRGIPTSHFDEPNLCNLRPLGAGRVLNEAKFSR